jgi:hypothetical protein
MASEEIINKHFDYLNNEFEVIKNILEKKDELVNNANTTIDINLLLGEK